MGLRFTDLCIDANDPRALADWWSQVLGWPDEDADDGDVILRAPGGVGPDWLFLGVPEGKAVKNRIHFDLTPDDQDAEVERVIALGARRVDIGQGEQTWVVLADPEGNEFCILAAEG
ncbi:putative enzyme related to lactoylglutathione lyase [Mycolicibacterium iranicum]|uniref:Putative enzyme related to lactoylglutathione lyase n=1 Tax=Mycolicibacterium iranicum TaxID=912594 RepID=A0A839QF21_MYCIR|nr:VOC family protein [Mycolicibacterium iranicum]MBB2993095.1 putative enzyme related to lactoylglutathione lyase [Mycolicibacterium iranicum]